MCVVVFILMLYSFFRSLFIFEVVFIFDAIILFEVLPSFLWLSSFFRSTLVWGHLGMDKKAWIERDRTEWKWTDWVVSFLACINKSLLTLSDRVYIILKYLMNKFSNISYQTKIIGILDQVFHILNSKFNEW